MKEKQQYQFSPTQDEVNRAFRLQAINAFKLRIDPAFDLDKSEKELGKVFAPLKQAETTEKYSLEKLAEVAETTTDERIKHLYNHESKHASQIIKVFKDIGVLETPYFIVYYVPILADMFQAGAAVGLIETKFKKNKKLTREQTLECNRRLANEMLRSRDNSSGDLLLISSLLLGEAVGFFTNFLPSVKK